MNNVVAQVDEPGRDVAGRNPSHYLNHAAPQSISKFGLFDWRLRAPDGTCREWDRRTFPGQGSDERRRSATYASPRRPA